MYLAFKRSLYTLKLLEVSFVSMLTYQCGVYILTSQSLSQKTHVYYTYTCICMCLYVRIYLIYTYVHVQYTKGYPFTNTVIKGLKDPTIVSQRKRVKV